MVNPRHLLFFLIALVFLSCKSNLKYKYSIKDFRKPIQPYLIKIVSKGIVGYYDSTFSHMSTDDELRQLLQSEHPILRASAFREMLDRKSINHFDILMDHLDDTAIIPTNGGEFGIFYRTVSDDILSEATWRSQEDKNKTIDAVLTKHNYLKSAYLVLPQVEPREKYYAIIKNMATSRRNYSDDFGERGFDEREYAIYGLAKFKKKDDINIIKEQLLENCWRMNAISFKTMAEFPDTAYLQVYEKYFPGKFYRLICREQDVDKAVAFINSIATYKNQRSSNILDSILNKKPFINCPADTGYIRLELINAIRNNECAAYSKLRKQIEQRALLYGLDKIESFPSNRVDRPVEKIVWWR